MSSTSLTVGSLHENAAHASVKWYHPKRSELVHAARRFHQISPKNWASSRASADLDAPHDPASDH